MREKIGPLHLTRLALAVLALVVSGFAPLLASGTSMAQEKPLIRMGSTNFSEQIILAELYAQILEANGYRIERRLNLGSREIVFPAIESGQIDIYPEYLATMLAFATKNEQLGSGDAAATFFSLQEVLSPRGLTVLDYASAVDTNALVVTRTTAERYGLRTTSDLVPYMDQLTFGGPPTCPERVFCMIGLRDVYGLTFKDFKPLDTGGPITVAALESGQIDVALLFSSDAVITAKGLVSLEDDKHLQLADNVAPVIRSQVLSSAPEDLPLLLNSVSALLTTDELIELNWQVGVDRQDPKDAAGAWLRAKSLVG